MSKHFRLSVFVAWFLMPVALPLPANPLEQETTPPKAAKEDSAATLQALKTQIEAMRAEYEKRLKDLQVKVEELQAQMLKAAPEAEPATPVQTAAPATQAIPGALNPAIGVVGNFVARADNQKVYAEDSSRIDNKFSFREAEIDFRVPVDPYADGVLIVALGADVPGQFSADVEEGYVNIKKLPFLDKMPLGLKMKVGRFRPDFGKTNILHTHDLLTTYRPLPVQEFLGEEGFIQSGVSGNFFLPTPWDEKSSIDATLQVLTGGDIAISPEQNSRNSYSGRLRYYRMFSQANQFELGWSSYYRPGSPNSRDVNFHGLDFTYRWNPARQGNKKSFLFGGELMLAHRAYPEAAESYEVTHALEGTPPGTGKPLGFTLFSQWQLDRRKYVGVRWDYTDVLYNPAYQRKSITPYFSYYFSEFLRFRLNYEHRWSDLVTEDKRNSVFAELNFVFGAHPPEPYWVNK